MAGAGGNDDPGKGAGHCGDGMGGDDDGDDDDDEDDSSDSPGVGSVEV